MKELNYEGVLTIAQTLEDVGVYMDCGGGERIYDIIQGGDGQNPIGNIDKSIFKKLLKNGWLAKGQCTNYNHRRFYYALEKDNITLEKILPITETDICLDGKTFYILVEGTKTLFINIDLEGNAEIVRNRKLAQKYTKQDIWGRYYQTNVLSQLPYWYSFSGGNGQEYSCRGCFDVKDNGGKHEEYQVKGVELVDVDSNTRYRLEKCVDKAFNVSLGALSLSTEEKEAKKDYWLGKYKILNHSVGVGISGSIWSPYSYWKLSGVKVLRNSIIRESKDE